GVGAAAVAWQHAGREAAQHRLRDRGAHRRALCHIADQGYRRERERLRVVETRGERSLRAFDGEGGLTQAKPGEGRRWWGRRAAADDEVVWTRERGEFTRG